MSERMDNQKNVSLKIKSKKSKGFHINYYNFSTYVAHMLDFLISLPQRLRCKTNRILTENINYKH